MRSTVKNIFLMISVLSVLALSSCEEVYTSDDELFYRISEADSTRCMNEILEDIRKTAKENQDYEDDYKNGHGIYFPDCILLRPTSKIEINREEFIEALFLGWTSSIADTADLITGLVDYCMMNRNLTQAETASVAVNPHDKGFEAPLYNQFTLEEIDQSIERTTKEYQEIAAIPEADSALIEFYKSKVDEWKKKKRTLLLIKSKTLPEMASYIRWIIEYPRPSATSEETLDKAALAFYYLRNVECMRYFGETYVNLYDRFQRKNQSIDREKLEAIEVLRPNVIYDKNLEVSPRYYGPVEAPPLPR